jgi:hypothetical protein
MSLGFPTPLNLAICDRNSIIWVKNLHKAPLETLLEAKNMHIDVFCKKLLGTAGAGAFSLRIIGEKLFINDKEAGFDELKGKLDGKFLLQNRIRQHPIMSKLYPHSINTIRLITFNNGGKVEVFSAALRIGTHGQIIDNWARGGIIVGIDVVNGKLHNEGLFKPGYGGRVLRHPNTDVPFQEFEIPYFHRAVSLVTELHTYLYGIHSIGWDIGITEEGPVIIEGNDDWEGGIPMSLEKNFKSRFLSMY